MAHSNRPTRILPILAVLLVPLAPLGGCRDAEAAASAASGAVHGVFAQFQQAVLDGDRAAFFALVTPDLLEVADQIDVAAMAHGRSEPLQVLGIEKLHESRWHVLARDPRNDGVLGHDAVFVIVRHAGSLRVDLVASAAATGGVDRRGRDLDTTTLETRERADLPGVVIPKAATAQPGTGHPVDADRLRRAGGR